MNNDKQIEELEISFYIFFFEEEESKELREHDLKEKDNFGFMILSCRDIIRSFSKQPP